MTDQDDKDPQLRDGSDQKVMSYKGLVIGLVSLMAALACVVYFFFLRPENQSSAKSSEIRTSINTPRTQHDSAVAAGDHKVLPITEEEEIDQAHKVEYSIRNDFDKHYLAALAGEPGAQVGLHIVLNRCSYAYGLSTEQELRNRYENSFQAHSYDYTAELETFADCHFVNSHYPVSSDIENWSMDLLRQAADSGDVSAKAYFALVDDPAEAAEILDANPEVLKDSVHARYTAFHIMTSGSNYELIPGEDDPLTVESSEVASWALFVCAADPACSVDYLLEKKRGDSPHYAVDATVSKWQELEKKADLRESFDLLRAYDEIEEIGDGEE